MSGLDIGILLFAILGAFLGMKIGAVSAFFNIVAGFAGSWAAGRFYVALLPFVPRAALAYGLVFLAAAGGLVATGIILSHVLASFFLGLIDKFLGALLGIALTLVFSAAVLMPALLEERPAMQKLMRRSAFAPYLLRTAQKYGRIATRDVWIRVIPALESDNLRRARRLLEASR